MTDRVNKNMPYEKEGVVIHSKLDELMMQYYRVPTSDGGSALHIDAFDVGQKLQYYFAVYSTVMVNESLSNSKISLPDIDYAIQGLEAPITLMLDNEFYQNNFQVILTCIIAEITRMNTSRAKSEDEHTIGYALSLCKWEYLSIIAGLVAGSKKQREMDIELRTTIVADMDNAFAAVKKYMAGK